MLEEIKKNFTLKHESNFHETEKTVEITLGSRALLLADSGASGKLLYPLGF